MKFRLKLKERTGGAYFLDQHDVEFIRGGAEILDAVLGGGWALSRVVNLVGDKSTGKTLLALEACINFNKQFPKGRIRYCEPEAALGRGYAREMGVPMKKLEFADDESEIGTVEDWAEDLEEFLDELKKDEPGIYVLDSLDALSSEAEMKRTMRDASYGDGKAKKMSELFRKLVRKIKQKRVLVIIISQVRDNIGVTFGDRYTRSGGKALDFYASQVLWLAQVGNIQRVITGVTRSIGVMIRARCKKNKVGLQFRECNLDLRYGYGIDDVASNVKYLRDVKKLNLVHLGLSHDPAKVTRFLNELEQESPQVFNEKRKQIAATVKEVWREVEAAFLPKRRKYG